MKGLLAVRTMKALGVAKGNITAAIGYAMGQGAHWSDVVTHLKSTVSAMDSDDMASTTGGRDYAAFIRPGTLLGKLAVRRVPLRTRTMSAISAATAYWSGEGGAIPMTRADLAGYTLDPLTVSALCCVTTELLHAQGANAESSLSQELFGAGAAAMDDAFCNPSNAGVARKKPASIFAGISARNSIGTSIAAIDADLGAMVDALAATGADIASASWVMSSVTAGFLARQRGTGGALAYPEMSAKGGTLAGLSAFTAASGMQDAGSPTRNWIGLVLPGRVTVADDDGAEFDVAESASVEMTDSPAGGAAQHVSLFQANAAALRATRHCNWRLIDADAVQLLAVPF